MQRRHRLKAVVALAAWLVPCLASTATGLHLAFDADHQLARLDPTLPALLRGPAHTHETPDPAPAVTADSLRRSWPAQAAAHVAVMPAPFGAPRLPGRCGFPGRAAAGPDPPQPATSHSILRI